MWIVRLALRRPYTFVVVAILILLLGILSIERTPKDIFPDIDIPVISIVWSYQGLSAGQMADRIITNNERAMTTTVNNIEHIESQSLDGVAVIKVFFHQGANISTALAQITSISQTLLKQLPPGTTPPLIITYSASSVPVLQLGMSGKGLSEQQLYDLGNNFIRTQLANIEGASLPFPYGGKQRQIQVDLNTAALQSKGLSPLDVVNAISTQNLILPSGTAKIGTMEYDVEMNGSPTAVDKLNDLPIKTVGNTVIYIRDVAYVRDGYPPQTNIVRVNGQRSALMTVQKTGNASTLDIISRVKQEIPQIMRELPPQLKIQLLSDQSVFVKGSITGVVREAVIAACLTAAMILLFIGSWRSTLIIAVSIPLSILTSIIVLSAIGQTINMMTLGGLALAVGILVDDATVEVENINRNRQREPNKRLDEVVLDSASQIAIPALVSTLSICIVFVPMFLLPGVARFLFVPLAEAVVFAMLASYLLSRTLVPTMAKYLLRGHEEGAEAEHRIFSKNLFVRTQAKFETAFEMVRVRYRKALAGALAHRRLFAVVFIGACLVSFALLPTLGENFFPSVDSGQIELHMRARTGTRIEDTAALADHVEDVIREQIPPSELSSIIDNIGLPYSGINLSYSNSAPIGSEDADILVTLSAKHHPTAQYENQLRLELARKFPGVMFYFLPADMVRQILNFGLPAPIDVQVVGLNLYSNHQFASQLVEKLKYVPGIADLRIQQPLNLPELYVDIDRTRTAQLGFTQREVASDVLIALSGSFQTSPTFWLDPKNGVSYNVVAQTPQYWMDSLQDLENIPISNPGGGQSQVLANLASIQPRESLEDVSHYNVLPVIDIYGSVEGRDLGSVSRDIDAIVQQSNKNLPRGSRIIIRGEIQTMRSSYAGLLTGLAFSIVLVYMLIVVNFQSWLDPLIIVSALPAAMAGIVWCLFITGTTLSVPALTGTIMCMGVATANSILVVSFAREAMENGLSAVDAALQSGFTRFRPVLMTALAMIIGMIPMALGLGDGGELNAPLGRAVIGGLLFATVSTLLFVPAVFSIVHGGRRGESQPEVA